MDYLLIISDCHELKIKGKIHIYTKIKIVYIFIAHFSFTPKIAKNRRGYKKLNSFNKRLQITPFSPNTRFSLQFHPKTPMLAQCFQKFTSNSLWFSIFVGDSLNLCADFINFSINSSILMVCVTILIQHSSEGENNSKYIN